jgi:hypothetical protein
MWSTGVASNNNTWSVHSAFLFFHSFEFELEKGRKTETSLSSLLTDCVNSSLLIFTTLFLPILL